MTQTQQFDVFVNTETTTFAEEGNVAALIRLAIEDALDSVENIGKFHVEWTDTHEPNDVGMCCEELHSNECEWGNHDN